MTTSQKGKQILRWLPRESVLLETDGPFAILGNKQLRPVDSFLMIDYLIEEWELPENAAINLLRNNLKRVVVS
jgi:TatD DNase family protein